MKKILALIATVAAVSAFAQTAPAPAPAPKAAEPSKVVTADCGKNNEKCNKSKPVVAPAPAPVAKDQKAEAPKK